VCAYDRIFTVFEGEDTMKKSRIAIAAVAFLAMTPAMSLASFILVGSQTTLDQLLTGNSLQVGETLFDQFHYQTTGQMPAASTVFVQGIQDDSGNYGVLFSSAFTDAFGGGASSALLSYSVTALDSSNLIVGANLFGDPTVSGSGIAAVTETFLPLPNSMNIFDNSFHTGTTSSDTSFAQGATTVSVQKGILAFAATRSSSAALTEVGQTFVQQSDVAPSSVAAAPEPGTLVLLLTGVLAAVPAYRFRRRNG
jgi:hypothetical protein